MNFFNTPHRSMRADSADLPQTRGAPEGSLTQQLSAAPWVGPFNNLTGYRNDKCAFDNQRAIFEEPIKYITNDVWLHPDKTNGVTTVGYMKVYHKNSTSNFPIIGESTRNRDQHSRVYIKPYGTTPHLGNSAIDRKNIEVDNKILRPELTSVGHPGSTISQTILDRWDYVDPRIVQNPKHIIFPIPRGGIMTNNILRNQEEGLHCR